MCKTGIKDFKNETKKYNLKGGTRGLYNLSSKKD